MSTVPGTEIMTEDEMDWSLGINNPEPVLFRTPVPQDAAFKVYRTVRTVTGEKMCGSSHVGPITWTGARGECATCCGQVSR